MYNSTVWESFVNASLFFKKFVVSRNQDLGRPLEKVYIYSTIVKKRETKEKNEEWIKGGQKIGVH